MMGFQFEFGNDGGAEKLE